MKTHQTAGDEPRRSGVGHSLASDSERAGREAVLDALDGRKPTVADVMLIFTSVDYDCDVLFSAAAAQAAPAAVVGCTVAGSFTHDLHVPHGCVAALLPGDQAKFGVCHTEYDPSDIAGSARHTLETARQRAGNSHPNSVVLLITDGLTPDQREVARGAYEITGAAVAFVGGSAGDDQSWTRTLTYGEGRVIDHGILAVWINSSRPTAVSVDHGWRPAGRPMLVTRAEGTVAFELDGMEALAAYLSELEPSPDPSDPEFFQRVAHHPVGTPNALGRYDVRQVHAYLPAGGGINFNSGVSEHSVLQVMSGNHESLLSGAKRAAESAAAALTSDPQLALVFSCVSRRALLGEHLPEEVKAISLALRGTAVCGFFTYGEFARVNGSSGVHNASISILAL